jgi:hypothetical protein
MHILFRHILCLCILQVFYVGQRLLFLVSASSSAWFFGSVVSAFSVVSLLTCFHTLYKTQAEKQNKIK